MILVNLLTIALVAASVLQCVFTANGEFSSEIVVASSENTSLGASEPTAESRSSESVANSRESGDSEQLASAPRPVIVYNTPEPVHFPRYEKHPNGGQPVLKYSKRYILTPKIIKPYGVPKAIRSKPYFRYTQMNKMRPIKRAFVSNKPIFMPKFVVSQSRPEYIFTKPPHSSPIYRAMPTIHKHPMGMMDHPPIRTSPEYSQFKQYAHQANRPRIPDYIYKQQAVAPKQNSVIVPATVAALPHQQQLSQVTQQFNQVKLSPQQLQPQQHNQLLQTQSTALSIQQPQYALPPQNVVQQPVTIKETRYLATMPQKYPTQNYQQITTYNTQAVPQYQSQEIKEQTLPQQEEQSGYVTSQQVINQAAPESGYVKYVQYIPAHEEQPRYVLSTQRMVYHYPQPQQSQPTYYITHPRGNTQSIPSNSPYTLAQTQQQPQVISPPQNLLAQPQETVTSTSGHHYEAQTSTSGQQYESLPTPAQQYQSATISDQQYESAPGQQYQDSTSGQQYQGSTSGQQYQDSTSGQQYQDSTSDQQYQVSSTSNQQFQGIPSTSSQQYQVSNSGQQYSVPISQSIQIAPQGYSQEYGSDTASSTQQYQTVQTNNHMLSTLRAHRIMAQYPAETEDVIVGTPMAAGGADHEQKQTKSTHASNGSWSTLTAANNISADYSEQSKDHSHNAIVEVPAPKLSS